MSIIERPWLYRLHESKGDRWDNAVVESFFGTLKQEHVHWILYQTRLEAQQDVLQYIATFYNPIQLRSYLGYMSSNQYELAAMEQKKVA